MGQGTLSKMVGIGQKAWALLEIVFLMGPEPSGRTENPSQEPRKDSIMPRQKGLEGFVAYAFRYKKLHFLNERGTRFSKDVLPRLPQTGWPRA